MHIRVGTEPDPEPMADINTTPLVDVLLVLLVMLIITIPVQLQAVSLEMPGRQSPPPPVAPVVVRLDIDAAGRFHWNGEPLADRPALEARLKQAAAEANPPEIHVRPDRRAKYEVVAAALTSAQHQGLAKIGIVGMEQFAP
jgi:biopolymer transport protein ExbD